MITDNDLIFQFKYLGYENLLSKVVCLSEYSLLKENKIKEEGLTLIHDCIKQKKLPIINFSNNPISIEMFLPQILEHFDCDKFFILNCNQTLRDNKEVNVAYWPFFLLFMQTMTKENTDNFSKSYRISSLMRHTRLHRIMLFNAIKPWITADDVVVVNATIQNNIPIDLKSLPDAMSLLSDLPYANKKEFLDLPTSTNKVFDAYSSSHLGYKAMVNITNESCYEDNMVFITEKTWKAYLNKCLVVNYGSINTPNQLKQLGFEIWEDFDKNIDYKSKIQDVVRLFKTANIEEIYHDNCKMIEHNYHLARDSTFSKKLSIPALEKIQRLL